MTAKSKSKQIRPAKTAQSSGIEERIRRRAYELYEQRGRTDGLALDDWLQAERELLRAGSPGKAKAARGSRC
jgi:Protein of unknown function (DUF2934)